MRNRFPFGLTIVVGACLSVATIAFADDVDEMTAAASGLSPLDPLMQLVAPDLARIAQENAGSATDPMAQNAFAAVFCPTHQRFEAASIDFSKAREPDGFSSGISQE